MDAVTLTVADDQELFEVATALANIAEAMREGQEIEDLPGLLNVAGMKIAAVMAGAYEREQEKRYGFN